MFRVENVVFLDKVIRLLSERILVLESQNRVYSEIIERGKKDDKRA